MFTKSVPTAPWPPWCGLSIGLLERAKSGGLFGKLSISLRTSWATWCARVSVACSRTPEGLWLWSAPLKKTALDGTEYNLLLLVSEGIDAYDQTGTYITRIFSLAVLLSSMFIYNQMGGIDETALDRLCLVTQMAKHIRVKAGARTTTASELGQIFYLDLVADDRRITPRNYLELALQPVQGSGKEIAAKNEIRDSIRALFPGRECFTLLRPLNNENDLQRLDQISLDKLRPEFRAGLDALTKFVFERTRPKQVGATILTGHVLIGITESYLDALNKGASVEEAECRRACDSASNIYRSTFDRTKPPEGATLREAHEEAVERSLAVCNASAVGVSSMRKKYEELLQNFFKKEFEDYKRNAFMETDLQCSNAIQSMGKRLRAAWHASDASIDNVVKVLENMKHHAMALESGRNWITEGPILDFTKRRIDQIVSEKNSLLLKCRSIEDKMKLLNKHLEDSEKYKSEYLKCYDDAINDKKKLADEYARGYQFTEGEICSGEGSKEIQLREDTLREEFSHILSEKEEEIKDNTAKVERAEQSLTTLKLELKVEIRELVDKLENAHTQAQSFEGKARIIEQEKTYLEQKYSSEFERFAEVEESCRVAEKEARKATELADKAREESVAAQKEISEIQRLAMERLSRIERAERQVENLTELDDELHRISHAEANNKAEALSLRLQAAQAKLDSLQQELTPVRLNETALDSKLKAASHGKRFRTDDEFRVGSVQDVDRILRANKSPGAQPAP
ncbi:hypothetical protein GQ457_01G029020 [Hibiscus cannabinus]